MYVHNLLGTMAKTTRTMTAELGRKPTDEEVAARMKVPVSKVRVKVIGGAAATQSCI